MKVSEEVILFVTVTLFASGYCEEYIPDFRKASHQLNHISSETWKMLESISEEEYRNALNLGFRSANQDLNLEMNLKSRGVIAQRTSQAYAQFLESRPNENSQRFEEIARKLIKSNIYFVNKHCLPKNIKPVECAIYLATKSLPENTDVHQKCEELSGGNRFAYTRLLPARYKDGVYEMLKAPQLPRPRRLARSADLPSEADQNHPEYNLLLMQWAQFIEHDLSKSVTITMHNGDPIKCCTPDHHLLAPRAQHPACAPLEDDEVRNEYTHVSCHNYVRNAQTINNNCTFGPAVMLNQENGKLDLSPLYGITLQAQAEMRSFRDGLLKTSGMINDRKSLLPYADDSSHFCVGSNPQDCYMAGDSRVNSNPFATHLYTIFLRSHNAIAQKIQRRNPHYSDEEIFRLARKQNIDEYVAIVYNFWLPIAIGENLVKMVKTSRLVNFEKTVSSEFGVAAMRFYLSMMPDLIELNRHCNGTDSPQFLELSQYMYNSDFLNRDCEVNALLDAMLNTSPHKADFYYKSIVLKNCLKSKNNDVGINCLALDIQRGRDHGLASYVKYLEVCANTKINGWSSLEPYINTRELHILKSMYRTIDEVDLIVGAMSEKQTNGVLGLTFSCILADEFSKIWNQTPNPNLGSKSDLVAAQLLCRTTDIKAVPRNIFMMESKSNQLITC